MVKTAQRITLHHSLHSQGLLSPLQWADSPPALQEMLLEQKNQQIHKQLNSAPR